MPRPFAKLAVLAAVVAAGGLVSCQGDSPTDPGFLPRLTSQQSGDSASDDSIPGDSIPGDSIPGDTIPPDTIPPDTIPPDTIPPDTIPPDTIPPDTIPPDTIPPDTIPPDTSVVTSFDLIVTVVGADSSLDTLQRTALQGARVRLLRFAQLDSTSAPNWVSPWRPTNRHGMVTFHNLRPAWYRVEVTPPRGSNFLPGTALVAPATTPLLPVQVLLLPAP